MGICLDYELCRLLIVLAQKRIAHATATAKNAYGITKKRMNGHFAQGDFITARHSDQESQRKREKIQMTFWSQVGAAEHINLPKLEDAIKKEFKTTDDRFIQAQVRLMQTEDRIRVQSNVKVWIKQPNADFA